MTRWRGGSKRKGTKRNQTPKTTFPHQATTFCHTVANCPIGTRGPALSRCSLIICREVRLKVRGHKWLLVSAHHERYGPSHKSCDTADQGGWNPIFYHWPATLSVLSPSDVPPIGVIAFFNLTAGVVPSSIMTPLVSPIDFVHQMPTGQRYVPLT